MYDIGILMVYCKGDGMIDALDVAGVVEGLSNRFSSQFNKEDAWDGYLNEQKNLLNKQEFTAEEETLYKKEFLKIYNDFVGSED